LTLKGQCDFNTAVLKDKLDITLEALGRRLLAGTWRDGRYIDAKPLLAARGDHIQKKTLVGCEQDRPDVSRRRAQWRPGFRIPP
jgi:hypothetical protein